MNKEFPHYWICSFCAKQKGGIWPKNHVATMAAKQCEYCNGEHQTEQFIAPWVDYDWPTCKTAHLRD